MTNTEADYEIETQSLDAKVMPTFQTREGRISCSVFLNRFGDDEIPSVSFQKSWKKGNAPWTNKRICLFSRKEVENAIKCLQNVLDAIAPEQVY